MAFPENRHVHQCNVIEDPDVIQHTHLTCDKPEIHTGERHHLQQMVLLKLDGYRQKN